MNYAVRGMMYPADALKPTIVWIPVHNERAFSHVRTRWAVDLNIDRWFPEGSSTSTISRVPDLSRRHPLRNNYSIFVAEDSSDAPTNECLQSLAGLTQKGNVLVIRHSVRRRAEVTHMQPNERSLVDMVVIRCVTQPMPSTPLTDIQMVSFYEQGEHSR